MIVSYVITHRIFQGLSSKEAKSEKSVQLYMTIS